MERVLEFIVNRQKLFEDNLNLVYFVIRKYYPNLIYDEDIIQCARIGLWQASESWEEGKSKFSTYATKCIRNALSVEFRQRNRQPKCISMETERYTNHGTTYTIADSLVGQEDIDYVDIDSVYTKLNQKEREILKLYEAGLTMKEIGERLGCSKQAVSLRFRKIKALIKRKIL